MVSARDISSQKLIEKTAEKMEKEFEIPEWTQNVKTGAHKERLPDDPKWWYKRLASLLRKVYTDGPIGIEKLRLHYGGKKNLGHQPSHFKRAGGKVIRTGLQELEKAGLIKTEKKGRTITPKGQKYIDQVAKAIKK